MKARIQRLRAEIQSDWRAFEEQLEELVSVEVGSLDAQAARQGELARAAVALHHGYGAVEAALARLARVLGEGVPEGRDWHQALLHAMALEIEGVRPAVLSAESVSRLRRLLGFRHFSGTPMPCRSTRRGSPRCATTPWRCASRSEAILPGWTHFWISSPAPRASRNSHVPA